MLDVIRLSSTSFGTIGVLLKDGHPFCWTLEDPINLLDEGTYNVFMKGKQLEILTPNGAAFFTSGEIKEEAEGNILLGFRVFSPRCITDSRKALYEFYKALKNVKETTLTIRRL